MKKRLKMIPFVTLCVLAFVGMVTAQGIIPDGGFEAQTTAALADPWWIDTEDGSVPAGATIEVELTGVEAFEGSNNLMLTTTPTGQWIAVGQDLMVEANTDYALTFYIKADTNIAWDENNAWSKGYMKVTDADGNALADNNTPRYCDGEDEGVPWASGELVFGCVDMSDWREYVYLFNSGSNTEVYLVIGTYVNNVVTWRIDGFSLMDMTAADIIPDGGFEVQTTAALADPWWIDTEDGSVPAGATMEVELTGVEAFEGSNNMMLTTTPTGQWIAVGHDLTVEANTDYAFTFYIKADTNIAWDQNNAWSKGYMKVTDADGNALADNNTPRCCDGEDEGVPWTSGELVFGCYDMSDWREYVYLFNSGSNTEVYLVIGTYVNNVVTWRIDGFSALKGVPATAVDGEYGELPEYYSLKQNYPNPFNPSTTIRFSIATSEVAKLVVYDLVGTEVRTLANGTLSIGEHAITWDGRDDNGELLQSGVYFYKLEVGNKAVSKKLTYLK